MMHSVSSLSKRIALLENSLNIKESKHINFLEKGVEIYGAPENKIYIPSPTGLAAHMDDTFVRCIMGPYGSGKSTWAINEMVRRTCNMPVWSNGRRRARWAIVRNTSGELQSTTLQTWLN